MKDVNATIDGSSRPLLRFLRDMVEIPTVNPPGECYVDCVDLMRERFEQLGLETRTIDVPNKLIRRVRPDCAGYPRPILWARWDVGAPTTLQFNAHYDVVPAGSGWRTEPFAVTNVNGCLYGRGTNDMKGAIAAFWTALRALKRRKRVPAVNVELSLVPDEETGGELGAGYLVSHMPHLPDYVLVGEGGKRLNIGCGHSGTVWAEVEVEGRAAHTMFLRDGINAFEHMATLVGELGNYRRSLDRRGFTDPSGSTMSPLMNVGGQFGGDGLGSINTVPAIARFSIDRRVLPNESSEAVEREIRATVQRFADDHGTVGLQMKTLMRIEPSVASTDSAVARAVGNAVRGVRRRRAEYAVTRAFTDMRYFAAKGIPTTLYGVGGDGSHGPRERVTVRELVRTAKIYAHVLARWA